jgi:hypothetical protein
MKSLNINKNKFNALFEAFNFYAEEDFDLAIKMLNNYRKSIRQNIYSVINEINLQVKKLTIIIVTHDGANFDDLIECVKSVNINHGDVEVVLINNGVEGNFNYHDIDEYKSITILNLNCNVLPSEARNIGAIISNSEWIYFIDDDAVLITSYEQIFDITKKKDFYAARGLVLPKSKGISIPKHYNLGDLTFPSELNMEGNLLIRRSLFLSVGGFDSLLFAHEGKDLTKKIKSLIGDEGVLYHPKLVIEHNPSFGEKLFKKRDRNMKSKNYLEYKDKIYAKDMRALFVVVFDDISDAEIANVENIKSKYDEIDFDFILIYKKPYDLILKLKNSSLRFRSVVLRAYNNSFISLDERRYSFAAILNPKIEIEVSDIKGAISESLVLGTYSNVGNIGYLLAFDKFGFGQYKISNKISELIEHYKQNKKFLNVLVPDSSKGIEYKSKADVIFISFHTTDEYYSLKATNLKNCLDKLGLHHDIQPFSIPVGMEWPDVCRKKVSFYFELFKKHSNNYKKIVWIDADCNLNYIPSFIFDFNVDFMAFRRGFPNSKHIDRNLTRHWEPCFFVFKSNAACLELLSYAADLEINSPNIKATDDYFFEEAWRKFGNKINVFEIPGEMSSRGIKFNYNEIESRKHNIFFNFGDSGHVAEFKGKVIQHEKMAVPIDTKIKVEVKANSGLDVLIKNSKTNKLLLLDPKETFGRGYDENNRELVKSLYQYDYDDDFISLNWWIRPAPGNMGDWLSPYIVHKITGKSIHYGPASQSKMISLGSIGRFISDDHTVWGTGISARETELNKNARYLAVRGPYTAKALIKSGGVAPKLFGDPAIIMPQLFKSDKKAGSDYGLVRHFIHHDCDIRIEAGIREINILLSSRSDIENFIDQLHECKAIITTSLHVVILCVSYGIPCRLISIDEKDKGVHGDGVKYGDFYEGVNLVPREHFYTGNTITRSLIEDIVFDDRFDHEIATSLKKALMQDVLSFPEKYR